LASGRRATALPEGDVVEFHDVIHVAAGDGHERDDEGWAALQHDLDVSLAEQRAGQLIDTADVLADLRTIQ